MSDKRVATRIVRLVAGRLVRIERNPWMPRVRIPPATQFAVAQSGRATDCKSVIPNRVRPDGAEPRPPATRVARWKADARPEPRRSHLRTTAIVTATAAAPRREPRVSAPRWLP